MQAPLKPFPLLCQYGWAERGQNGPGGEGEACGLLVTHQGLKTKAPGTFLTNTNSALGK